MSFISTQPGFSQPDIHSVDRITTQFGRAVLTDKAHWLSSALADLWDLEQNGGNIPGFGDFRLAPDTAMRVKQFLFRVGDISSLPVPKVSVFSGGGVSLSWSLGGREVNYTFWPEAEGTVTYSMEESGRIIIEDDLRPATSPEGRKSLQWLSRT